MVASTTRPFKCKRVLVVVNGNTVGVVEGMAIEFIKDNTTEPHYGSDTHHHAVGTRHGTFSIRRWMFVDTKKKLLFELFENDTSFNLEFGVSDMEPSPDFVSGMKLILSNCLGKTWRPVTGATGDVLAEELIGNALDWIDDDFDD